MVVLPMVDLLVVARASLCGGGEAFPCFGAQMWFPAPKTGPPKIGERPTVGTSEGPE